ncbi:hypothetical protein [Dysgonomonas sp. Marseille-P4361]|uniref:hypothetical protein n=1 Tax=Dysgonomonas sp. Marseille-P4361 TaxID=2161820 RepID=UPI001357A135|nr:hypothetical protein [Dysgonomonas sp. Marseille-P4361]
MKTIFDYNPTSDELKAIGFYSFVTSGALGYAGEMTKEVYMQKVPQDKAIFDTALLLEYRNQDASELWAQIPEMHDEYVRGFDYEQIEA